MCFHICRKIKCIDFVGVVLALAGSTLLVVSLLKNIIVSRTLTYQNQLALQWAGSDYPWKSVHVIVTLVVGFFTCVAFAIWQWKGTKVPLIKRKCGQKICLISDGERLTTSYSPNIPARLSEWRMLDHVHQRMELSRTGLLYPDLLSVGV